VLRVTLVNGATRPESTLDHIRQTGTERPDSRIGSSTMVLDARSQQGKEVRRRSDQPTPLGLRDRKLGVMHEGFQVRFELFQHLLLAQMLDRVLARGKAEPQTQDLVFNELQNRRVQRCGILGWNG
jgi:hypothetical protein